VSHPHTRRRRAAPVVRRRRLHLTGGAGTAFIDAPITVVVHSIALRFGAVGIRSNATRGNQCRRLTQLVRAARAPTQVRRLAAADDQIRNVIAVAAARSL